MSAEFILIQSSQGIKHSSSSQCSFSLIYSQVLSHTLSHPTYWGLFLLTLEIGLIPKGLLTDPQIIIPLPFPNKMSMFQWGQHHKMETIISKYTQGNKKRLKVNLSVDVVILGEKGKENYNGINNNDTILLCMIWTCQQLVYKWKLNAPYN